jgi:acetyl-CoA carboxylase biotin carboxyl carrier protein
MNSLNPENIQDLKHLIELLKENQVAEFELDRGGVKVRLKFNAPESSACNVLSVAPSAVVSAASAPVAVAQPSSEPPAAAAEADASLHIVKSPIVGTFYSSSTPGAAPFVAPGDRVEKGKVVGIIEAMKLMNEIECDVAGEIVKCFVASGQPVEYGQPLFSVRIG